MLATWLAALLFLFALQALLVVTLADRLTVTETAGDRPARSGHAATDDGYARAA